MPARVGILISGSGSNMVSLVEAMQAGKVPAEPVVVVSNVPDAGGLAKATALGVATAIVDHREFSGDKPAFEAAVHKVLVDKEVRVVCLAGFMRILSADFVSRWQDRMLNIHPSLLPKYKGLDTHQRALDAGDAQAGCSVHLVTPDLDAGPILGQRPVDILPDDTAKSLAARVLEAEHQLYPACLKSFLTP